MKKQSKKAVRKSAKETLQHNPDEKVPDEWRTPARPLTAADHPVLESATVEAAEKLDPRLAKIDDSGLKLYAKITRLCSNKRLVIVKPFMQGFNAGRMVVPRFGKTRKKLIRNEDGEYEQKTFPSKFAIAGSRLWVRPVDGVDDLYEFIK